MIILESLLEKLFKSNLKSLIANGWDYTIERREALKFLGLKEQDDNLIWYNKEKYSNYCLLKKVLGLFSKHDIHNR